MQRAIRKAERAGIQIVRGTGERDLREFFRLHVGTRRRLGVPAQPFRFFRNLGEEFGAGRLVVLLAQKGGVALAGLILLKFKDTVYYKFGASRTRFWSLRPNHLLFWTAIRQSAEECYRFFEFGRTSEADTGLMNFKRRWGADSFPLHYLSYGPGEQRLDSLEQGRLRAYLGRMLRILPASFTRVSGQLLYPYLG